MFQDGTFPPLRLSLFLVTLVVLRCSCQAFGRMSLDWNLLDVFLMIRLGIWIWGEVKCHFLCSHRGTLHHRTVTLTVGCAVVRFLHQLLFHLQPVEGVTVQTLLWPGASVTLRLCYIYMNYLEFFCTDLSLFSHLLIYSIIYLSVWTHGYLFNTLGCNPILSSFIVQIAAALTVGSLTFF